MSDAKDARGDELSSVSGELQSIDDGDACVVQDTRISGVAAHTVEMDMLCVVNGDVSKVPKFISSLFDFLQEGTPPANERAAFVEHLSVKSMHILSLLFSWMKTKTEELETGRAAVPPTSKYDFLYAAFLGYAASFFLCRGVALGMLCHKALPELEISMSSVVSFLFLSLAFPWSLAFTMQMILTGLFAQSQKKREMCCCASIAFISYFNWGYQQYMAE